MSLAKIRKVFDTEELLELLDCGFTEKLELVRSGEIIDKKRWSLLRELIFREKNMEEGFAWRTYYETPATESCDIEAFWSDQKECTLVELEEVTIKKWTPTMTAPENLYKSESLPSEIDKA